MQMHSLSLARQEFLVDLIGYHSSDPHEEVRKHANVSLHGVSESPDFARLMPRFVAWTLRLAWQSLSLLMCLAFLPAPDVILVQNPPSVPTLPVCWLVARLRGARLLVDWHNYGHTILRLQYSGEETLAVKLYKFLEVRFGSFADDHMCVTKALQKHLLLQHKIRSTVIYDRPSSKFAPISLKEKHELLQRLSLEYPVLGSETGTRFTEYVKGVAVLKEDRPALLVSSTSWTEDEDFSVLLRALHLYSKRSVPRIVCVITGKGPLKEFYCRLIQEHPLEKVDFVLPWLHAADYPLLLASADLGVCLHTSSSGLDLPMKVVDMFGCHLPVCAYRYDCIDELVVHERNGLLFETGMELANQLTRLLKNFPRESQDLDRIRVQISHSFREDRWHEYWLREALPLFRS